MSGTPAFLQLNCSAKSDWKNVVLTSSGNKVCDCESLIRRQDKILSTKESALANGFLFISFLGESVWYVAFVIVGTMEVPAL